MADLPEVVAEHRVHLSAVVELGTVVGVGHQRVRVHGAVRPRIRWK